MTEKKGTQSHICKKSVLNKIELQNIQQKIIIDNNNQNIKFDFCIKGFQQLSCACTVPKGKSHTRSKKFIDSNKSTRFSG